MTDGEIIAAFMGFLLGALVMIIAVHKSVENIWESAYNAGVQYGIETEIINQANKRKEELFGK